jgi:hypothetical protein
MTPPGREDETDLARSAATSIRTTKRSQDWWRSVAAKREQQSASRKWRAYLRRAAGVKLKSRVNKQYRLVVASSVWSRITPPHRQIAGQSLPNAHSVEWHGCGIPFGATEHQARAKTNTQHCRMPRRLPFPIALCNALVRLPFILDPRNAVTSTELHNRETARCGLARLLRLLDSTVVRTGAPKRNNSRSCRVREPKK